MLLENTSTVLREKAEGAGTDADGGGGGGGGSRNVWNFFSYHFYFSN